ERFAGGAPLGSQDVRLPEREIRPRPEERAPQPLRDAQRLAGVAEGSLGVPPHAREDHALAVRDAERLDVTLFAGEAIRALEFHGALVESPEVDQELPVQVDQPQERAVAEDGAADLQARRRTRERLAAEGERLAQVARRDER